MTDEAVAKPGNGLCFTRTRGVPNQVAPAGPFSFNVSDSAFDGAQLVEAREYQTPIVLLGTSAGLKQRVILEDS